MPRIRSLKPEMASDVKLSTVSMEAELTFVLMITQADDVGLLAGNHRQLLGALYPLRDAVTVPRLLVWIEELVAAGIVRWRATRDGIPVLEIVNWSKHQRISNAGRSQLGALLTEPPAEPQPPTIPPPDLDPVPTLAEARGDPPQLAEVRGLDHRSPITDLGSPTTDQWRVRLTVAANNGLAAHPTRPQAIPRIMANSARSQSAAELIQLDGVPLDFAESAVYELARSHTADNEISSLNYFVAAVHRKWEESRAANSFVAGLDDWAAKEAANA